MRAGNKTQTERTGLATANGDVDFLSPDLDQTGMRSQPAQWRPTLGSKAGARGPVRPHVATPAQSRRAPAGARDLRRSANAYSADPSATEPYSPAAAKTRPRIIAAIVCARSWTWSRGRGGTVEPAGGRLDGRGGHCNAGQDSEMNNPISHVLRRPGDPAPVSLAYPSSHPGANADLLTSFRTCAGGNAAGAGARGGEREDTGEQRERGQVPLDGAECEHVLRGGRAASRRPRGGQLGPR